MSAQWSIEGGGGVGGSSLESEILNIESGYLHFICFAMDFVNSSQCCKAEKKKLHF